MISSPGLQRIVGGRTTVRGVPAHQAHFCGVVSGPWGSSRWLTLIRSVGRTVLENNEWWCDKFTYSCVLVSVVGLIHPRTFKGQIQAFYQNKMSPLSLVGIVWLVIIGCFILTLCTSRLSSSRTSRARSRASIRRANRSVTADIVAVAEGQVYARRSLSPLPTHAVVPGESLPLPVAEVASVKILSSSGLPTAVAIDSAQ